MLPACTQLDGGCRSVFSAQIPRIGDSVRVERKIRAAIIKLLPLCCGVLIFMPSRRPETKHTHTPRGEAHFIKRNCMIYGYRKLPLEEHGLRAAPEVRSFGGKILTRPK